MTFIGQELKRERELRGISLQEISDSTKINIHYLRDLEEDRLENLPGKFFIKGIIRSYAKYIGLDEFAVLNSFYQHELYKNGEEGLPDENKSVEFSLPGRFKKIIFTVSVVLVLMAGLTAIYFFISRTPEVQEPVQISTPVVEPPPAREPILQAEEQGLILDLSFRMETWIQVFADGVIVVDGIKYPGESFQVKAEEELVIHTGNAGGLIFSLNGKDGISLGPGGTVVRDVRITPENMAEFIEKSGEEFFR